MFDYIKGTVTDIKNNAIVLDNNGVGYLIHVSNPYSFEPGVEYKVLNNLLHYYLKLSHYS